MIRWNEPEGWGDIRVCLHDLITAIKEALTVYRRRKVIKANIRRMSARLPF